MNGHSYILCINISIISIQLSSKLKWTWSVYYHGTLQVDMNLHSVICSLKDEKLRYIYHYNCNSATATIWWSGTNLITIFVNSWVEVRTIIAVNNIILCDPLIVLCCCFVHRTRSSLGDNSSYNWYGIQLNLRLEKDNNAFKALEPSRSKS